MTAVVIGFRLIKNMLMLLDGPTEVYIIILGAN